MLPQNDQITGLYTDNRELSWLKFNRRVLDIAGRDGLPALERLRFLAIFTSNLDEFCMIRVGSIHAASLLKKTTPEDKTGMTPSQQLDAIFKALPDHYLRRDELFEDVERELRAHDVFCLSMSELDKKEKKFAETYFKTYVQGVLSPQVVDARHPFPHLENKALYVALALRDRDNPSERIFGIVAVPQILPAFVSIPGSSRYILIERLILEYADTLFKRSAVQEKGIFSVTRNADIVADSDDDAADISHDFKSVMRKLLKKRGRLAPVRLECELGAGPLVTGFIARNLKLTQDQVFLSASPLVYGYVEHLSEIIPRSTWRNLIDEPYAPGRCAFLSGEESVTRQVMRRDVLFSFPYEEMDGFLRLLRESAQDPDVISIKITIYRLGHTSRLIEFLKMASENGKEVMALMELRARFDEQNNIEWADELERAGCNVIYGIEDYKVHSKICLITRRDRGRTFYLTQIGTGNYNESTGKIYADFSLITADQSIGADAAQFFVNMATSNLAGDYRRLLVAPDSLLPALRGLIDAQIERARMGGDGAVLMKLNSLTDREIIDKLSEASCAGVRVRLIVRGICCLIPGVPGRTENVSVVSIVGRFLEHARVYVFGAGENATMYLSSADMMERNIRNRVEIACPVTDRAVHDKIMHTLELQLRDNAGAHALSPEGRYVRVVCPQGEPRVSSQLIQMEEVLDASLSGSKSRYLAHLFKKLWPLRLGGGR